MRKLFRTLGVLFVISGIVFLLIHSFVVTSSPNESFARDLFGFPIPHPPLWTSYIPYLGGFLRIIFEFLSIHGFIGIVISGVLLYVGSLLISLGNEKNGKENKQRETEETIASRNSSEVVKQKFVKGVEKKRGMKAKQPIKVFNVVLTPQKYPYLYKRAEKEGIESFRMSIENIAAKWRIGKKKSVMDILEKSKPVEILGAKISAYYYPVLYRRFQRSPKKTESWIKSLADRFHEGNIVSAIQILESDLAHETLLGRI